MDCWLSSAGQEEGAQDRQRSSHREDTQGLRDPRLEEATSAEEERKAPEHPAQWAQCLALTRAACQAGLGQGGSQGVFPPPAQVRLIEHQTRGNRGGDRWGRAVLHGVWGWGCESRRGGQGPGDRAEKTVAAGPKHEHLGLGHSWSRHAATAGQATGAWESLPVSSAPCPGPAGLALYKYS